MNDPPAIAAGQEFFDLPTLRLHAVTAGPADGPLVILLHGFPEFWYSWRHQIGPLAAAGFRVVAPDQRGYNLSDKPKRLGAYCLDRLAEDVRDLIQACGRERAFVVGHDWGGVSAWWAAVSSPEVVAKLAILNVPHPIVMRRFLLTHAAQRKRSWYIYFFQWPWLPEARFRANNFHNGVRALRSTARPGTFSDDDVARYREAWAQPGALKSMIDWYRAALRRPPKRRPSVRVKPETLVLWGEKDRFLSAEMIAPSLALCDHASEVRFPDASHWVQHEKAEAVNERLVGFFRS